MLCIGYRCVNALCCNKSYRTASRFGYTRWYNTKTCDYFWTFGNLLCFSSTATQIRYNWVQNLYGMENKQILIRFCYQTTSLVKAYSGSFKNNIKNKKIHREYIQENYIPMFVRIFLHFLFSRMRIKFFYGWSLKQNISKIRETNIMGNKNIIYFFFPFGKDNFIKHSKLVRSWSCESVRKHK